MGSWQHSPARPLPVQGSSLVVAAAVVAGHASLLAVALAAGTPVELPPSPLQVMMLIEPPPTVEPLPDAIPRAQPLPPPPPQTPAPEVAISEPPPEPPPVQAEAQAPAPLPASSEEPLQTVSLADGTIRVVYPALSRRLGEEGVVVLRIRVEADGRISAAAVLQSSGFPRLDEAARRGALGGRMRPAMRGDTPVAMSFRLPVQFVLRPPG